MNMNFARPALGALVLMTAAAPAMADTDRHGHRYYRCQPFSELSMVLEQNATDGDSEIVLFAKGQDDGLSYLRVRAPSGRVVARFLGPRRRSVGIREFQLESAEPPELERVLASFPEGTYRFSGWSVNGECLRGTAQLSHELAPTTTILAPAEDDFVPVEDFTVEWAAVAEAETYVVEVKNEETDNALLVDVPAPATTFEVPASWLEAGVEHQVAVAVRTANGNVSSVELVTTTDE